MPHTLARTNTNTNAATNNDTHNDTDIVSHNFTHINTVRQAYTKWHRRRVTDKLNYAPKKIEVLK